MLAAAGRVGFDPGLGGSFHRLLPFGGVIDELNPRLLSSRALLDAGAVSFDGPDMSRCKVLSGDHHHVVQLAGQGAEGSTCTCAWYARYLGSRGPCKHVLAAVAHRREVMGR